MDLDFATIGGGMFSIVTAAIAYMAATGSSRSTTRDSDKDIFVTAVTNERAKWREELRRSVTEFMKQCLKNPPNPAEILRLKTDIVLRLNPEARDPEMAEKHKFDKLIQDAVEQAFNLRAGGESQPYDANLQLLEEATQQLLKQEWEKSKVEAATGRERGTQGA